MRRILLSALLLLVTSQIMFGQKFPSKIDSINDGKDVEQLIRRFGENYEKFSLKPIGTFQASYGRDSQCKQIADSLKITKSFYKADLDNNGYTDLLAIGDYYDFVIFVVLNYGNDSLVLNRLTRRSFQECTYPVIINDGIRYYYFSQPDWRQKNQQSSLQYKDLVFRFGDFIEKNSHPANYSIEKIEYQTSICFGTCPKFFLSIDQDQSAVFKAELYNENPNTSKEIKGEFFTTLNDSSYLEIINLLNYIDFPKLEDKYAVNWTDDQSSILTITYNDGHVKTIKDYGMIGTYGLDRLYQLLFALRFNQDWKK